MRDVLYTRPRWADGAVQVLLIVVAGLLLASRSAAFTVPLMPMRELGAVLLGAQLLLLLLVAGLCGAYVRIRPVRLPLLLWTLFETLILGNGLGIQLQGRSLLIPPALVALSFLALISLLLALAGLLLHLRRQPGLVRRDLLTDLVGREDFMRMLPGMPGPCGTLLLADVNRLKQTNDLHGHAAGDQLILSVVRALQEALPESALLARWGGDELLAFLPGAQPEQARPLVERAQALAVPPGRRLPAQERPFSFGLARLEAVTEFQRALAVADHALYRQKGRTDLGVGDDDGLIEFSRRLEALQTPEAVIHEGLRLARELLRMDVASYAEVRDGLFIPLDVNRAPGCIFGLLDPGPGRALSGMGDQAARQRQTVVSVDYPSDPLGSAAWRAAGVKSMLVTAVEQGGTVVGLLTLLSVSEWKALPLRAQRVVELAALRLGHALELRTAITGVRKGLEAGLLGLGVALEARDLETRGHTLRVVQLSGLLGQSLRLSPPELDALQQGAYLHDIGKLSIPDRILLKTGALDQDEWRVMQTHAAVGADIAAHIPHLAPGVLDVICCHHERWDGGGYPQGRAGEAIPLLARIFAVCDVYDALTSERPYKRAWSGADALSEIEQQAGRQFDPQVVTCFLALHRSSPEAQAGGG